MISSWPPASGRARTARVRVLDERGSPTPARIYLTGPDGRAYAPAGVVHRVVTGDYRQPYAGEYYFYTSGTFDIVVPAGEIEIEAVKGLEYAPVRKRVQVAAGQECDHRARSDPDVQYGRAGLVSRATYTSIPICSPRAGSRRKTCSR